MKITDQIKTYEDACAAEGLDPVAALPYVDPKTGNEKAVNAFAKLIIIAQVLNEGWRPNWKSSEYKYYPWFYFRDAAVGSGFSFYDFGCDLSGTCVGSRLVFKSRELAIYAGEQFQDIYETFMVIPEE